MSGYLVEVKRSARRSNGSVGTVVCQRGVRHRFDSRDAAEEWASDLADDDNPVWIRAANPDDRSDVDAYLIGWVHRVTAPPADETPGDQAWLADFVTTLTASVRVNDRRRGVLSLNSVSPAGESESRGMSGGSRDSAGERPKNAEGEI